MRFWLELVVIDKLLCPKIGDLGYNQVAQELQRMELISKIFDRESGIQVATLPTLNRGLATIDIRDHVSALEAFRRVLIQWLKAEQHIPILPITNALAPNTLEMRKNSIVQFYVDTFFSCSSRAPLVPHCFPL